MSRILLRKLMGLGRDEDGAALVITLALLMFMYVTCAGVFAIGQSVKDKIHLQNACDAAAYSAAVIQADTLSRIATINKAMSWTYVSMVRRQQDYIVWKWLDEVKKRYHKDDLLAEEITDVKINRWQTAEYKEIASAVDDFDRLKFSHMSFYSRSGGVGVDTLKNQIFDDGETLDTMKSANDGLVSNLKGGAEDAAKAVLNLNLPQVSRPFEAYYVVKIENASSYLDYMGSGDESRFVRFSKETHGVGGYVSYPWFPIVPSSEGIGRHYQQKEESSKEWLIAEWTWWMKVNHKKIDRTGVFGVRGRDVAINDNYFKEHLAYPRKVTEDYFGSAGTITVGLAKYNENPWYRVFKDAAAVVAGAGDKLGGIFAAFNPHKSVEWTWAFSSAKAGYRHKNAEYDGTRAYCVDWTNDQDWNLCVSDWDAVFVPVRSARMKAENGSWVEENGNEGFLRGWVENGNWQPLDGGSSPDYIVAGRMPDLPQMHKSGNGLDWKKLTDLLYH